MDPNCNALVNIKLFFLRVTRTHTPQVTKFTVNQKGNRTGYKDHYRRWHPYILWKLWWLLREDASYLGFWHIHGLLLLVLWPSHAVLCYTKALTYGETAVTGDVLRIWPSGQENTKTQPSELTNLKRHLIWFCESKTSNEPVTLKTHLTRNGAFLAKHHDPSAHHTEVPFFPSLFSVPYF